MSLLHSCCSVRASPAEYHSALGAQLELSSARPSPSPFPASSTRGELATSRRHLFFGEAPRPSRVLAKLARAPKPARWTALHETRPNQAFLRGDEKVSGLNDSWPLWCALVRGIESSTFNLSPPFALVCDRTRFLYRLSRRTKHFCEPSSDQFFSFTLKNSRPCPAKHWVRVKAVRSRS